MQTCRETIKCLFNVSIYVVPIGLLHSANHWEQSSVFLYACLSVYKNIEILIIFSPQHVFHIKVGQSITEPSEVPRR